MASPAASSPVPVSATARLDAASDETLTGEAVALDVQPLGFFLRAAGCLIDMVAGILLLIAGSLLLSVLVASGTIPDSAFRIGVIVLLVAVTVAIPTAVETLSRGRSLGRWAVGGRIVRVDGGAPGFRQALIRALAGVLELWFTLGGLAAIVGMFTPRAQRLGDLLAGTACERTRTRPLPTAAPGIPPGMEAWAAVADVSRLPDRLAARMAQFVRGADALEPAARARVAAGLADAVRPYVAPLPAADPETLVRAAAAVRRDREYRALILENERAAALTPTSGA
ncbi:RDD family protein [Microbacterium enclense]|uniref:RDD family protein n=1 Tax=Microbacterium enclense TaxID=993073 RepID=A0A3S3MG12_9MICO|nr:RDD family protein [Microbacterium enclense]RWR22249.1 RDD family protein [Microbacterium enclense]